MVENKQKDKYNFSNNVNINTSRILRIVLVVIAIVCVFAVFFAGYKRSAYADLLEYIENTGADINIHDNYVTYSDIKKLSTQIDYNENFNNYSNYFDKVLRPTIEEQNSFCEKLSWETKEEASQAAKLKNITVFDVFMCEDGTYSFTYNQGDNEFWASGMIYQSPPTYNKTTEY